MFLYNYICRMCNYLLPTSKEGKEEDHKNSIKLSATLFLRDKSLYQRLKLTRKLLCLIGRRQSNLVHGSDRHRLHELLQSLLTWTDRHIRRKLRSKILEKIYLDVLGDVIQHNQTIHDGDGHH